MSASSQASFVVRGGGQWPPSLFRRFRGHFLELGTGGAVSQVRFVPGREFVVQRTVASPAALDERAVKP